MHYEGRDNTLQDGGGGGAIYCAMSVSAVDASTVQITSGVDAGQEVYCASSNGSVGSMLAIRIWANYR
jgi:hypothetical protein